MAEYIEREAAFRAAKRHIANKIWGVVRNHSQLGYETCNPTEFARGYEQGAMDCANAILATTAADVVEVVRKPVKGYEGYYEVDQFGRVFGVDRIISVDDNGRKYDKPLAGKQMKQSAHEKGYKTVSLTKDGKTKMFFVHRLVAEAFIPNPENLPMVNHKDEDKTNNFVENLEWCTAAYNNTYGDAVEKRAKKIRGRESEKRVAVIQRGILGDFVNWHPSITEAAKSVNSRPQAISAVCHGKRKLHRGYRWEFDKNDFCSYGERREENE